MEREKEEREKQITVTVGALLGTHFSNYSYRRAPAGELINDYSYSRGPLRNCRNGRTNETHAPARR